MANPARATLADLANLGPAQARVSRISSAARQAALNVGSDYLDGRLGAQYDTTQIVAPYPQDIIDFEVIFASYRLLLNVGFNPSPGNADDEIRKEYEQKIEWAKQVGAGEIPVVGLSPIGGQAVSGPDVITATTRGYSERGIYPGSFPRVNTNAFSDD